MNKYLVEFVGTLFFLYVILATNNAIAIGIALAIAIMVGGSISGGMFNPAVTLMMAAAGKLSHKDVVIFFMPFNLYLFKTIIKTIICELIARECVDETLSLLRISMRRA